MPNLELKAAIAAYSDKQISRHFRAISCLMSGTPLDEVSVQFGSGPLVISKWKRLYDEGGVELLLRTYPEPDTRQITDGGEEANAARVLEKIASETTDPVYRKRIQVVSGLLAGGTGKRIAEAHGIPTSTATSWLQFYRKSGLDGLKPRTGERRRKTSEIELREDDKIKRVSELRGEAVGAEEKYSRRLEAVATYLETQCWQKAQRAAQADRTVVVRWVRQYMEDGLKGLQGRRTGLHPGGR